MNIKEIISKLNLEEKFALLSGKDNWNTVAVERLGIPSITVADGPHGAKSRYINEEGKEESIKSVCFPTTSAMAATWNRKLLHETGKALARECNKLDIDILLGPGVNIKRTPLCGRNFEYFSEDPLLSGELAAEIINGIQSQGVGTSLKHYSGNNQEYDRFHINSEMDSRTMHEIYLKPFEIAVKKSQPWTVMCAYNRLNGIYCSENKFLLKDLLRDEFEFEGIVMSDWWAVHDRTKSLEASLELEMPFRDHSVENLMKAYEREEISEEEVDSTLERLLNFIFKVYESRKTRVKEYDLEVQHKIAKEVALEAVTLLKNEESILPIKRDKVKNIAVIGECAKTPSIQGGGSALVNPESCDIPFDKITELCGDNIKVEFAPAYTNWNTFSEINGMSIALEKASDADIALVFVGDSDRVESEGYDRTFITLPPIMEDLILRVAEQNPNTIVVVQAGSAIDMSRWIDKVKAVVFAWFTGKASGGATADILFGLTNPSGKIAESFPITLEDTPTYGVYPGNGYSAEYTERLMVGYRYYDTYNKNVLFPFGYGLSYTTFEYSALQISPESAKEKDSIIVSLKVKNTGKITGKETVQLYVRDVVCKVIRPYKELKGFDKVELNPGEEKEVKFVLDSSAFAYFNSNLNSWFVESGKFEILVGASSRDIRLKGNVRVKGEVEFS